MPTGLRLLIDAREPSRGDPAQRLLGLNVARRTVLAARRAGYDDIAVWVAEPEQAQRWRKLIDGAGETVVSIDPPNAGIPTLIVTPDVLTEREWLAEAAMLSPAEDEAVSIDDKAILTGPGVSSANLPPMARTATMATGPVLQIGSAADLPAAEDRLMSRLGKDTDGFMSRHVARPVSTRISRLVAPWPVSPNQMTLFSMALGLLAAPFFLTSVWWLQAIGGLLFVAHSIVDGCDGELARLKFAESRLGGLLDFWSDNIVHVAVFGCMGIGWALAVDHWWPLLVGLAAVAGAGGSALAVYWFTLRRKADGGPVYTSVSGGPGSRTSKMLDDLSRRDFIYLVLALSLFGKAHWFLILTAVGAPLFLFVLIVVLLRDRPSASETSR